MNLPATCPDQPAPEIHRGRVVASRPNLPRSRLLPKALAVLALLTLWGSPPPLQARLGETLKDCVLRYGEQVDSTPKVVDESDGDAAHFQKGGFDVHVEFKGGKAWLIRFVRRNISDQERDHLLSVNGAGSDWLGPVDFYGREHWIARSGNYHAMLRAEGRSAKALEIMSDLCLKARDRAREERVQTAGSESRGASRTAANSRKNAKEPEPPVDSLQGF